MGRHIRTPERTQISFTTLELQQLEDLAKHYEASVSWVVRQITIGKLSALQPKEEA